MEEAQYEKFINDQKQLLDDLYLQYENILNQRLDQVDLLIGTLIDEVNNKSSDIATTISTVASDVGYTLTDEMSNIWDPDGDTDVLTDYVNGIAQTETTIQGTVSDIYTYVKDMLGAIEELSILADHGSTSGDGNTGNGGNGGKNQNGTDGGNNPAGGNNDKQNNAGDKGNNGNKEKGSFFIKKKDTYPKSKLDIENSIVDRLKYRNFDSSFNARSKYYTAMGFSGTYTGSAKQNQKMISWMKANGFSSGGYIADLQKMAYRNGDDMITVNTLKKGEAVLTPEQAAEFKKLVQKLSVANSIIDTSKWYSNVPSSSTLSSTIDVGGIEVVIPIERVDDYNDFIGKIRTDKKFEEIVQSVSLDLLSGKSKLAKYIR